MHLVDISLAPGEPVDPGDRRHRCEWVSRARSAAVSRVDFFRRRPDAGFDLQLPYLVKEQER
jgi:hypothetical protein